MNSYKRHGLKRILSEPAKQEYKDYFVYPKSLRHVEKIQDLEKFLMKKYSHIREDE